MDSGKQGVENEARRGMEIKGLFWNTALLFLIFLTVVFASIGNIVPLGVVAFLSIIALGNYLKEALFALSFTSETLIYLGNTMDAVNASTLVQSLVNSRPIVNFSCWGGGCKSKEFTFDSWRDTSKVFLLEQGAHMVGLRLEKSYTFEDEWTEQRFMRAFEKYKRHLDSDDFPKHTMELDGFLKGILVMDPEKPRPIAVGPRWCILFTLLGLSWPYRMYIRSLIYRKVEHHITKVIQVGLGRLGQPRYIEHGQGHSPTAAKVKRLEELSFSSVPKSLCWLCSDQGFLICSSCNQGTAK